MIKTAAAEIKARFEAELKRHLKRWESENPWPAGPSIEVFQKELRSGKFTLNAAKLAALFKSQCQDGWRGDSADFDEIITTPSMTAFEATVKARDAAKKRFEELLREVRDNYQDRVLFDHESGFVLLRDFQRWRETSDFEAPSIRR